MTLELDALGGRLERDFDTALYDAETRRRLPDGATWQLTYYTATDATTGAVRGKLHQVRLAQLGTATNVLLQEFRYHADGTVKERVDYLSHGPPRTQAHHHLHLWDGGSPPHPGGGDGERRHPPRAALRAR